MVDDEGEVHDAVRWILETSEDFECGTSYVNGIEALNGISRERPDMVLMDIRLPDVSGIECTRRLRIQFPRIRIVMMSALDDRRTVQESIDAGCNGYLTKPFVTAQFLATLRCALSDPSGPARLAADWSAPCRLGRGAGAGRPLRFTSRELQVIEALAAGRLHKQIALELGVSAAVTNKLVRRIYRKLRATNRAEALKQWLACSRCRDCLDA